MVAEKIAPYGNRSARMPDRTPGQMPDRTLDQSAGKTRDQVSDTLPDQTPDRSADPFADLFERLSHSKFRSSFSLKAADVSYVRSKGMDTIRAHASDFIRLRLAPAEPKNDGKQTPTKGHPVFIAQHATGCCCRGCLEKWHRIPKGTELSQEQQNYVVDVLMAWIERQMKAQKE